MTPESNLNLPVDLPGERTEEPADTDVQEEETANPFFLSIITREDLKIEFIPSKRKTTSRVSIHIQGEFGITAVAEMQHRLAEILKVYDFIHFKLQPIRQLDVSTIQLFYLLTHHYSAQGKTITYYVEMDGPMSQLLGNCGFGDVFNTQNGKRI